MRLKMLMQWDINETSESEYYEFMVNDFIPRVNQLGLEEIQLWYTTFGDCEQIQLSGTTDSQEKMNNITNSEEWGNLSQILNQYVTNFSQKVVAATEGFQL